MYSMVMMAALATSPVVPDCHRSACYGCSGCYGCYGGCTGCYGGCNGCYGGRRHGCWGCRGCWGCNGCYGVVVTPAQPAPPPPPDKKKMPPDGAEAAAPARLIVEVPANAKVFIDDTPTTSNSAVRTFVTPPLDRAKSYAYTVRVEVMRDGEPVSETKTVPVTAGGISRLSFTEMASAATEGGKAVAAAGR